MMETSRGHQMVLLDTCNQFSHGTNIRPLADSTRTISHLSVTGLRGAEVVVAGESLAVHPADTLLLRQGSELDKVIYAYGGDDPRRASSLKVFYATVKGTRPGQTVGVRTSQDWNRTRWGTELSTLPGTWVIPMTLKPGRLEYKIVTSSSAGCVNWEPNPFENKVVTLTSVPELVVGEWAARDIASRTAVAVLKQQVKIHAAIPKDIQDYLACSERKLVMKSLRYLEGGEIHSEKDGAELKWSDYHGVFRAVLTVPGSVSQLRFTLCLTDHERLTHVDSHSHVSEPGYRQLDTSHQPTIACQGFVDVRPKKEQTSQPNLMLRTSCSSVYSLLSASAKSLRGSSHVGETDSKSSNAGLSIRGSRSRTLEAPKAKNTDWVSGSSTLPEAANFAELSGTSSGNSEAKHVTHPMTSDAPETIPRTISTPVSSTSGDQRKSKRRLSLMGRKRRPSVAAGATETSSTEEIPGGRYRRLSLFGKK